MTRRLAWLVLGAGAIALGVVLTPFVPGYALAKFWVAVCVLAGGSIAGLYYDARSRNR